MRLGFVCSVVILLALLVASVTWLGSLSVFEGCGCVAFGGFAFVTAVATIGGDW